MPDDLTDDLRALLSERAGHAPPAPAPAEAYVRRVQRRRTARVTAALSGTAATTAAAVAVVAAVVSPDREALRPAGPPPAASRPVPTTPAAGHDLPCGELVTRADALHSAAKWDTRFDEPPMREEEHGFAAALRDAGPEFDQEAYQADAGATCALLADLGAAQHDLRLRAPGGRTVWAFKTVRDGNAFIHFGDRPLAEGRYRLSCAVHESMRADVVVAQPSA